MAIENTRKEQDWKIGGLETLYTFCVFVLIALFGILAGQTFALPKFFNRPESTALITAVLGSVFIIISLTLANDIFLISDGVLFGGIAVLVYSVAFSLNEVESSGFTLLIVTIAATVTLVSGYLKFARPAADFPRDRTGA